MLGIIFDLDGTLVDTVELHAKTFKRAVEDLGFKNSDVLYKKFKSQVGKPLDDILKSIMPDVSKKTREKIKELKWKYTMQMIGEIKPIRKTTLVVKRLYKKKIPLALVSCSPREFVIKISKGLELKKYFKVIISAEDVSKGKPDPEGLLKAARFLHADRCIYVGDTVYDEQAAEKAGFEFLNVKNIKKLKSLVGMLKLVERIENLKSSPVAKLVERRIKEFSKKKTTKQLFNELAFCLLTANFNAERAIEIQRKIGNGFLYLTKKQLESALKQLGYRYPRKRAEFIVLARKHKDKLKSLLNMPEEKARQWLVKHVKGLGYKEASHFLRNVGKKNLSIIDFHIVDLLVRYGIIKKPKSLNKKNYLKIEEILKNIAKKSGLTLAELDLYLWFMETGKVLK